MGTGYSDFITKNAERMQRLLMGNGKTEMVCETGAIDVSKFYCTEDEKIPTKEEHSIK